MQRIIKIQNYNYNVLKNDLFFLQYEYPFFEIKSIGKSTLGEDIFYIKLGTGDKKLFINASHHANEWITSLEIMMFVENYLKYYKNKEIYKGYNIEELWKKTSLFIVPMVNPDGVNLCLKNVDKKYWKKYEKNLEEWKANIRGVDLNLNYPAGWEKAVENKKIYGPSPRDYPRT